MRKLWAAGLLWLGAMGCNTMGGPAGAPPGAGASPGGAQDIQLARSKVAEGRVPDPEDFSFEGMYGEHDLPLPGAACAQTLCLQSASAVAPSLLDGERETFVQVGLASNIDLATFRRPPLHLALVIDRSGSMANGKLEAVKQAAHQLVERLDERDLLTVVQFDDKEELLLRPIAGNEHEKILAVVDRIALGGGTCIECGLKAAYAQLRASQAAERKSRVLLFTDARPNVGATGDGAFTELVEGEAKEGVALTAFGVGLDFGQRSPPGSRA